MKFRFEITEKSKQAVSRRLKFLLTRIDVEAKKGMEIATENAAEDIQVIYKGNPLGFHDRTGALRESIRGGIVGEVGNDIVGHVSAGDENLGSNKRPTREYAPIVEFAEFSHAGKTAFLRPALLTGGPIARQIADVIGKHLNAENLI